MEETLKKIRDFAAEAHGSQLRKYTTEHYIVHPERVMKICKEYTSDLPILAAALLHDVLEDTPVSSNDMKRFLQEVIDADTAGRILILVQELTDVYTKDKFPKWNRRKRRSKEAERISRTSGESQTVKYADIIDNVVEIVDKDPEFGPVFTYECRSLLHVMPNGDPRLYERAVQTVDDCVRRLKSRKK